MEVEEAQKILTQERIKEVNNNIKKINDTFCANALLHYNRNRPTSTKISTLDFKLGFARVEQRINSTTSAYCNVYLVVDDQKVILFSSFDMLEKNGNMPAAMSQVLLSLMGRLASRGIDHYRKKAVGLPEELI